MAKAHGEHAQQLHHHHSHDDHDKDGLRSSQSIAASDHTGQHQYHHHHQHEHQHPQQQIAETILADFAVSDHDSRDILAECIARGHAPAGDVRQMWSDSLMHGFEAWEQLFACARGMQRRHEEAPPSGVGSCGGDGGSAIGGDDGPLEGTDLLGFVAKVLAARSRTRRIKRERRQKGKSAAETSLDRSESTRTGGFDAVSGPPAKRVQLAGKKRSKRAAESPYWSANSEKETEDKMADEPAQRGRKGKSTQAALEINRRPRGKDRKGSAKVVRADDLVASGSLPLTIDAADKAMAEGQTDIQVTIMDAGHDESSEDDSRSETSACQTAGGASVDLTKNIEGVLQEAITQDGTTKPAVETSVDLCEGPSTAQQDGIVENSVSGVDVKVTIQPETPRRVTRSSFFITPISSIPAPVPTLSALKTKSPRPPRGTVSCLPFPRLDAPSFGIAQERFTHDPFRLLIAVTFLIRTAGRTSMPVFRELMELYPTPRALADGDPAEIKLMIRHLGLSNNRTATIQKYARLWEENPPQRGVRYGVKNYPKQGDGKDVRAGRRLEGEDVSEAAWEIGHMTQGRYAIDSWRIFCRDVFMGRASNNDQGGGDSEDDQGVADGIGNKSERRMKKKTTRRTSKRVKKAEQRFQPEWMRVLPEDKELRAYLRWMWMREGWEWDPHTSERTVLSREMHDAVQDGRVVWDNSGKLVIVPLAVDGEKAEDG